MHGNALILTQILLELLAKADVVVRLLGQANAEGRDVTDAEVTASGLAADNALNKLKENLDA